MKHLAGLLLFESKLQMYNAPSLRFRDAYGLLMRSSDEGAKQALPDFLFKKSSNFVLSSSSKKILILVLYFFGPLAKPRPFKRF